MPKITINAEIARDIELAIFQCKFFFKFYIMGHKYPSNMISSLQNHLTQLRNYKPINPWLNDAKGQNLTESVNKFVKKHFSKDFIQLFEQKVVATQVSNLADQEYPDLFRNLLAGVVDVFTNFKEQQEKNREHQCKWLQLAHDCLYYHGLHPLINNRDPAVHKRFNLIITHYHLRKIISTHRILWTYEEFQKYFTIPFSHKQPIQLKGILIAFDKIKQVQISTTLLKDDEIELLAHQKGFTWNDQTQDEIKFFNSCIDETEKYHPNPFSSFTQQEINWQLVNDMQKALLRYPAVSKLYESALQKFRSQFFERNVLDDLRLCTELLMKELLGNQKSLENQQQFLGASLKLKGGSKVITNLFHQVIDSYSKYNNEYVKHHDKVNKEDLELMINLTNTLLRHLISKLA